MRTSEENSQTGVKTGVPQRGVGAARQGGGGASYGAHRWDGDRGSDANGTSVWNVPEPLGLGRLSCTCNNNNRGGYCNASGPLGIDLPGDQDPLETSPGEGG